jgi:Leucine-rich repeat (LRR) protein
MLSRLNALRELYLPYASAINASALVGLTNITILDLTSIHFADASNFSFLSQMPNLTGLSLRLGSAYFNDASLLANLVNLQVLDLGFISISNLSPLATLSNLEVLSLDFTRITDITPLSSLTNLRELDLSNTDVVELSPLVVLQGLQVLYLRFLTSLPCAEVNEIQAAMPHLVVIFEGTCH